MFQENTSDASCIKLYVPTNVAESQIDRSGESIMDTLKRRAADAYGGFTTHEGDGGWVDESGNLVEEKVTILEVVAPKEAEIPPKSWAKVNARWLIRASSEEMVMATVDDWQVTVE